VLVASINTTKTGYGDLTSPDLPIKAAAIAVANKTTTVNVAKTTTT
jgi:hypothetical protein